MARSDKRISHAQLAESRRTAVVNFVLDRRQAGTQVSNLSEAHKLTREISTSLQQRGVINPRTKKPYSAATIKKDLAETIGLWTYTKPLNQSRILLHVDTTYKDYPFWDALRRGLAPGYELSGPALCLSTAQTIASYCYGKGFSASLAQASIPSDERKTLHEAALAEANGKPTQNLRNAEKSSKQPGQPQSGKPGQQPAQKVPLQMVPKAKPNPDAGDRVAYTNLQLQTFVERNMGLFVSLTTDMYCLGNQYIIINPDCTLSIASPETVTVEYDASDYRRPVRYIIRTKMEKAVVEDVYTAKKRIITVDYYDERGIQTQEYENLIGRIPIVHWANDRSANEIYGRPIYEGQLPIMRQYDDLVLNMIEGVKLLGTPIPMFTNLDNVTETKQNNCDVSTYIDAEGRTQTEYTMRLDRQTGLFLGKGGDGKMLSTQVGFTKDSLDVIRQCFLLFLNGVRIPEVVWGGAIASSKASADAQMPPFVQYIQFRRLMLEGEGSDPALGIDARGGFLELIDIWLRMYKLLNPNIVVGPVQVEWPEIDLYGDQTKYLWASYLKGVGVITDETLVKLSGYVPNPAGEVRAAAGQKGRSPSFDDYDEKLRKARLEAAQDEDKPLDPDGPVFTTDWVTPLTDQLWPDISGPKTSVERGHQSPDLPMTIAGPVVWQNELG